jgi:hypothetical protein
MNENAIGPTETEEEGWDPLLVFSAEFNSLVRPRIGIATHRYHLTSATCSRRTRREQHVS